MKEEEKTLGSFFDGENDTSHKVKNYMPVIYMTVIT